jgi:hypothetical protein
LAPRVLPQPAGAVAASRPAAVVAWPVAAARVPEAEPDAQREGAAVAAHAELEAAAVRAAEVAVASGVPPRAVVAACGSLAEMVAPTWEAVEPRALAEAAPIASRLGVAACGQRADVEAELCPWLRKAVASLQPEEVAGAAVHRP